MNGPLVHPIMNLGKWNKPTGVWRISSRKLATSTRHHLSQGPKLWTNLVSFEPENKVQIGSTRINGTHIAWTLVLKLKVLWNQKLIKDFHRRRKVNYCHNTFVREILSDNTANIAWNCFIINKCWRREKYSYLLIYISEFFSFFIEVILKTQIKSWDFGKSRYIVVALKLFGMMEGWNGGMSSKICFVW